VKLFYPVLGFLLASLLNLPAQVAAVVTVEVTLDQEQFLPGEALPVAVRITNRSGQTLRLGGDPDWLTFSVESHEGFIVGKNGEVPVTGEFVLESGNRATRRVDLAPYFNLAQPGRYHIIAQVHIKEWDRQIASDAKSFDVTQGLKLWSEEFGVPPPAGATNPAPEVRKYILQQANYLRGQLKLYLRLTDAAESKVFKVFPLGPIVSFGEPEKQLDSRSNLHVVYQTGARSFAYTVINPDGNVVLRQTYDFATSRPRLRANQEGNFTIVGGARRVTVNDVPPPKP